MSFTCLAPAPSGPRGGMLTLVSTSRLLLLKPIVVLRDYVNGYDAIAQIENQPDRATS